MKIAFVHQPWDDASPAKREGSLAVWTHEVSRRLAGEHSVAIFGRAGRLGAAVETVGGVEHHGVSLKADRPLLRLLRLWPGRTARRPAFASWLFHYAYASKIGRRLARWGPDVVHVHNFSNFVPILRKHCPAARYALHMHCSWLTQLDARLVEPRLRRTDAIIGCSDFIAGEVRDAFPQLAGRCHSVPNGVDPERFAARDGAPAGARILFVGRVSPEKGIHVLLDAFALVHARAPHCELEIVGPQVVVPFEFIAGIAGPELRRLLAPHYAGNYIDRLASRVSDEFDGKVRLVGQCDHADVPRHYAQAAVVVNPSLSEAFGMSLIEAMAGGIPVVASDVGGMPEIIADGGAGLLVRPDDPEALAAALSGLLADAPRRAAMGRAGRARVADCYCWRRVVDRLLNVYGKIR